MRPASAEEVRGEAAQAGKVRGVQGEARGDGVALEVIQLRTELPDLHGYFIEVRGSPSRRCHALPILGIVLAEGLDQCLLSRRHRDLRIDRQHAQRLRFYLRVLVLLLLQLCVGKQKHDQTYSDNPSRDKLPTPGSDHTTPPK